jgi:hypothetical protein
VCPISAITFSVAPCSVTASTRSCTGSPSRAGTRLLISTTGSRTRGVPSVALATPRREPLVCTTIALAPARRALAALIARKQSPKPVNATSPGVSGAKSSGSQASPTTRSVPLARPDAE